MDLKDMKKGICTLKLENLQKVYNEQGEIDNTLIKATFSIIDFNVSGNNQRIDKTVALNSASSLRNKPLLCNYIETTDYENQNDDFTSHEEYEGKLRTGEDYLFTATHAIGVSPDKGYLGVIKNENDEEIDVLLADFLLWVYRYPNEIMLINDFYEKGEPLYSSCEYYYTSSNIEDGVEVINNLYFDGHTVLGKNIEPAYSSSKLISFNTKWNKAVSQLIKKQDNNQSNNNNQLNSDIDINNKNNNQKEDNNMAEKTNKFYKVLCELSYGDIREQIMSALSGTMTADEFYGVYMSNYGIYDSYFVYENYENSKYINYKVPYTKTETEVIVDLANKTQVERDTVWVEVTVMEASVNALKEQITEKDTTIATLNTEKETLNTSLTEKDTTITSLNSTITTLTTEKDGLSTKFEEATNSITDLSKQVNEMKPIVDTYNTEKFEQAFNEKKALYEDKFKAVNAKEKFDTEEVQNLIKLTVNEGEESTNAINSLNSMIADSVVVETKPEVKDVKEIAKSTNKLIDVNLSFEKRYGFDN